MFHRICTYNLVTCSKAWHMWSSYRHNKSNYDFK